MVSVGRAYMLVCLHVATADYSEVLSEAEVTALLSHGTISHKDESNVGVPCTASATSHHLLTVAVSAHALQLSRTTVPTMAAATSYGPSMISHSAYGCGKTRESHMAAFTRRVIGCLRGKS